MRSANVYNKELSRHQLGGFIPVYDQIPGTHYFLLDGNRLGFMFICSPSPGVFDNQQDVLTELFKMDFPADTICQTSLTALPDLILHLSAGLPFVVVEWKVMISLRGFTHCISTGLL